MKRMLVQDTVYLL